MKYTQYFIEMKNYFYSFGLARAACERILKEHHHPEIQIACCEQGKRDKGIRIYLRASEDLGESTLRELEEVCSVQ